MKNGPMIAFTLAAVLAGTVTAGEKTDSPQPIDIIVMDPLAAPLSCPCVEGYAQRNYKVLGEFLQAELGRKVKVHFSESLSEALKKSGGSADLIIGKDSVVKADAKAAKLKTRMSGSLTDLKGKTTQHGLIVVNAKDPAKKVKDLQGYTIIFGPSEADEKHHAAMKLLKSAGVKIDRFFNVRSAIHRKRQDNEKRMSKHGKLHEKQFGGFKN